MKIVFMGTPQAAAASLDRLLIDGHDVAAVYTQPDKPAGRGNKISASAVKAFAVEKDLPIYQPSKIKTAEALENFQSHRADVAVVVAYGRILPETFLRAFPHGAINVHFSLLPKYRGAAPVNWAMVNGETTTGVTTMRMDEGLDTGDILLQREMDIGAEMTAIDLMENLAFLGADLLSETLATLDDLTAQPQDDAAATFAPLMRKEDGKIEWNLTAPEINNRVRGFQPFPTSYTFYQDRKLTVWKAAVVEIGEWKVESFGKILTAQGDDLIIGCGGATALRLIEVQAEGKRRMAARDFLNGVKISVGEVLK